MATPRRSLERHPGGRRAERLALTQFAGDGRDLPADLAAVLDAQYRVLAVPRAPIAGVALDQPRLMGIVNVTPDSFSDGGEALASRDAYVALPQDRRDAILAFLEHL